MPKQRKGWALLLACLIIAAGSLAVWKEWRGPGIANESDVAKSVLKTDAGSGSDPESVTTIAIQANQHSHKISPTLYGLFYEDINYAGDGGLYGELIHNRSFEFRSPLYAWTKFFEGGGQGEITAATENPLNPNNPHYARIDVKTPGEGVGIVNTGYKGIGVQEGERYDFSVYARSSGRTSGPIEVSLKGTDGAVYGSCEIMGIAEEWMKHSCSLASGKTSGSAQLAIAVKEAITVDIDMISLAPEKTWMNRANGLRYDMAEMLDELNPSFLRFPGGCIVEGGAVENHYDWKNTIGDVTVRKTKPNQWGEHYYQSFGLGFDEYFRLAGDLDAEPLPIVYAGITSCSAAPPKVPMNDLQPYIDHALDLIEYANGDAKTTTWGTKRAENGHPEPYNLTYLGIGNELWGIDYFARYKKFHDAIKEKYPDIQLVMSAGAFPDDAAFHQAYEWLGKEGNETDLVDEHMYQTPIWFLQNTERYDSYDRNGPKVFVGEYAAHGEGRRNNMEAALAEAAFMTGLERNSDIVAMASYAPLFSRTNYTQWTPDLIWFNNTEVMGTPNYYVQQLFGKNVGDYVLPLQMNSTGSSKENIAGSVLLGSWNTQVEYEHITIESEDGKTLFQDDFKTKESMENWTASSGNWKVTDGKAKQISQMPDSRLVLNKGEKWTNYTIKTKARKIRGEEGMLIGFGVKDSDELFWWNIGGWGNTRSAIEKTTASGRAIIGKSDFTPIAANTWYDIEIRLNGDQILCYLDGKLIHEVSGGSPANKLFATATADDTTGELILKVVNPSEESQPSEIRIDGMSFIDDEAKMFVLESDHSKAENSYSAPDHVSPVESTLTGTGREFSHEFPAYSVTVLRLRTKKEPIVDSIPPVERTVQVGEVPELPQTVSVNMSDGSVKEFEVEWKSAEPEQYASPGLLKIKGTVESTKIKATAMVSIR